MAKIDLEFQKLFTTILINGKEYHNNNRGVKRLQIPSYNFRHSFDDGFPAITIKKLYFRSIVGELIWFLRGDNDIKYLNDNGISIWNKDAYNWHKSNGGNLSFEEFIKKGTGSVGRNYSVQWRSFNGYTDQIDNLIKGMNKDIMSSRLKVNAWNPSELDLTALPPCHSEFQIIGVPLENDEFGFELHWNQRSVDSYLGLPFNVASYALLANILEQITGFKALAIEGSLKCVHFYDNQYEAVKDILKRDHNNHKDCQLDIPTIKYNINTSSIFDNLDLNDFKLNNYTSDKEIKVEMLAVKHGN